MTTEMAAEAVIQFNDDPELVDPNALYIFAGDLARLDGLIVNGIIESVPWLKNTSIRHRAFVTEGDDLVGIHIGTLASAKKEARKIYDQRVGIIDGKAKSIA